MEPILSQPDTDIGTAWKREVDKFNTEHPECMILSKTSWISLESIDKLAADRRNAFGQWRKADPPDSKRAWLKAKLKDMTGIAIKLIEGAGALAGGAFAPAPAIAQVLTFLLAKTTDLSDHLDNLQDFFDLTETLFMRLELIERRMPKESGFVRQLERVFAKILQLLGIAVSFTKRNKFKLFLRELGEGNNDAKDAWTAIQNQIGHLDSSVMYATLGAVQKNREASARIEMGVQSVDSKVRLIQKNTGDINISMQHLFSAVEVIKGDVRSLAPKGSSAERAGVVVGGVLQDGGTRVLESFNHLRARLANPLVDDALDRGLAELSAEYLPGTCCWIEREELFLKLVDDDHGHEDGAVKSLLITGGALTGKSMLASYILAHLKTKPPRDSTNNRIVAYFRFGKDFGHQRTVQDMLCSCIVQIADQSPEYCKLVLGVLQKSDLATADAKRSSGPMENASSAGSEGLEGGLEGSMLSPEQPRPDTVKPVDMMQAEISKNRTEIEEMWTPCFKDVFVGDGPDGMRNDLRLFLILDGMDKVDFLQVQALTDQLSDTLKTRGRMRLIFSTAPGYLENFAGVYESVEDLKQSSPKINLSDLKKDIKTFTAASIRASGRLRILRPEEQANIAQAIAGNATSFLHASYLVRRVNAMGLVDPVQVARFNPIGNMIDEAVYADLLKRCAADRPSGEIAQLQCLFVWLTHCDMLGNRCMSRDAAMSIMGMVYEWPPLEKRVQMRPTPWNAPTRVASHWTTERQWERLRFDFPEQLNEGLVQQGLGSPERFEEEYERNLSRVLTISTLPTGIIEDLANKGRAGKDSDVLTLRYSSLHQSAVLHFTVLIAPTIAPQDIQSALVFTLFSHAIVAGDNEEARRYAADYWLQALQRLEFDYESDHEKRGAGTTTAVVVDCIANVLSNENGALRALEAVKDVDEPHETLSIFGENETEIDKTLRMIEQWVKAAACDEGIESLVSKSAKTWLRSVTIEPTGEDYRVAILRETARHHMRNWLGSDRPDDAYASCRFTQRAIFDEKRLSGDDPHGLSFDDGVERLKQLSGQLTAAAHNAIAMAYRYDGENNKAIEHLESAIDILDKGGDRDPNLHFAVYGRLGRAYYAKFQKIIDQELSNQDFPQGTKERRPSHVTKDSEGWGVLEEALKNLLVAVNVETEPSNDRVRVLELEARVQALLRQDAVCVQKSIERAVEVSKGCKDVDDPFTTRHFEDLVHLLMCADDAYGTHPGEVMALVNTLGAAQLAQTYRAETHQKIREAAKIEDHRREEEGKVDGETCVARLAALYDEAVKTMLENENDYAATVSVYQSDLALFVQEDKAAAKAAINAAVNGITVRTDPRSLTRPSWRLADMLLEQFIETHDLEEKRTALMEMESLLRRVQELRPEFEAEQSQMSIPLYLMRRVLGPADGFFRGADDTFRGCVAALKDDVADNDVPSLQVLAKVLRLVPGLEEEAAIVASAQLFALDHELAGEKPFPIACSNVACGRELGKTDEAWLCCLCTNTLLCGDCRDQKRAKTGAKPDPMWYPCHRGHQGIDMPAKQLSSIGQKRIFLTGNTQGILIVDWLKELEGKWDLAWKKYWNQSFVG